MLLVYDGQCGFCVRWARWLEARLNSEARVEPWQSLNLDDLGLSRQQVEAAVWWLDERGGQTRRCSGADAIGRALVNTGGVRAAVGWLIIVPPLCWLARPIYALVAANRHRVPGFLAPGNRHTSE